MRIVFRYGTGSTPSAEHLEPGEPVWDDTKRRLGLGIGGQTPVWYPGFDSNGHMLMNTGQLLGSQANPGLVEWSANGIVLRNGAAPIVDSVGVASAANYLSLTNAVTGAAPSLAAAGADSNISLSLSGKGSGVVALRTAGGVQAAIGHKSNAVNFVTLTGGAAGEAVTISADGASASVDIVLAPKGGGYVRLGGYSLTTNATVVGYLSVQDTDGNVRKLAVIN